MILYNNTNQIQELKLLDYKTKLTYSIFICANSSLEVEDMSTIIDLDNMIKRKILSTITPIDINRNDEEVEAIDKNTNEVIEGKFVESIPVEEKNSKINKSEFICNICGSEFASSRGLSSHMKKSHRNQSI